MRFFNPILPKNTHQQLFSLNHLEYCHNKPIIFIFHKKDAEANSITTTYRYVDALPPPLFFTLINIFSSNFDTFYVKIDFKAVFITVLISCVSYLIRRIPESNTYLFFTEVTWLYSLFVKHRHLLIRTDTP